MTKIKCTFNSRNDCHTKSNANWQFVVFRLGADSQIEGRRLHVAHLPQDFGLLSHRPEGSGTAPQVGPQVKGGAGYPSGIKTRHRTPRNQRQPG